MEMDFCETIRIFIPLISILTKRKKKKIKFKLPYLKCKRKNALIFPQTIPDQWNIHEVYYEKMYLFLLWIQTKNDASLWNFKPELGLTIKNTISFVPIECEWKK